VIDPGRPARLPAGPARDVGPTRIGRASKIRAGPSLYMVSKSARSSRRAIMPSSAREPHGSHCTSGNSTIQLGSVIGDRVRIHCNIYIAQYTTSKTMCFSRRASRSPTTRIPSAPSACRPDDQARRAHRRQRDAAAPDHDRRERARRAGSVGRKTCRPAWSSPAAPRAFSVPSAPSSVRSAS